MFQEELRRLKTDYIDYYLMHMLTDIPTWEKLKISDELSGTLPLLSYLGITYKKNEVVKDVLEWFEYGIDFLNYGNPIEELRMAVSNSEDVKQLMLEMCIRDSI